MYSESQDKGPVINYKCVGGGGYQNGRGVGVGCMPISTLQKRGMDKGLALLYGDIKVFEEDLTSGT